MSVKFRISMSAKDAIINCIVILVSLLVYLFNNSGSYNTSEALLIIIISVLCVIKTHKNIYLFIITAIILYCNYSICVADYIFPVESYFTSFSSNTIMTSALHILLLFVVLLFLITSLIRIQTTSGPITENNTYNPYIIVFFLILLLFIWVYGFTRPSVEGGRGSPSALYEYSIIFFIIGFYHVGTNQVLKRLLILSLVLYVLQNFIYGGRITGVQLLIVLFLSLYQTRIPNRITAPVAFILLVILSGIGHFRGSFSLSKDTLYYIFDSFSNGKLTLDTAYSAYFTSFTFLDLSEKMSAGSKLFLFLRWIESIFLGGRVPNSNLAYYTAQFYTHYNGGVLPYFFYFYCGIVGIIIICVYLFVLFRIISNCTINSSGFIKCFSIYISATTFRWYLYSPSQLFRGVLLLAIVYYFAYLMSSLYSRNAYEIRNR